MYVCKCMYVCMYMYVYVCRAVEKEESIYHQLKFDLYFGDIASVILSTSKIEYIAANCEDDNVSVCMYVCMYVINCIKLCTYMKSCALVFMYIYVCTYV